MVSGAESEPQASIVDERCQTNFIEDDPASEDRLTVSGDVGPHAQNSSFNELSVA